MEKRRCLFDKAEPNPCNRTYDVSSEWKKIAKEVGWNGVNFIYTFHFLSLSARLSLCMSICLSIGILDIIYRRNCAHCVCYGTDAASNFAATENEAPNLRALCLGL